jgi:hypothetical protein
MNVTDKQVDTAQSTYNEFALSGVCDRNAMSKAIEAAIQAAWVKYDPNDIATHPNDFQHVIVLYHTGIVGSDKWSPLKMWMFSGCKDCVVYWMPLPEHKGELK